ncbi:hypothetical protein [Aeromonas salmonicida]|uniref:hypothetical protein n=1 Tax=Aeromonas salmonicida TaxID=645 RepID=UPI00138F331C|nr:hypothetical protein [Aeromonas salmonicida]
MKRFTHDEDLRGMVVLRSLGFQLVPFKLHRFRKQRPAEVNMIMVRITPSKPGTMLTADRLAGLK